jgi:hypothetical protein
MIVFPEGFHPGSRFSGIYRLDSGQKHAGMTNFGLLQKPHLSWTNCLKRLFFHPVHPVHPCKKGVRLYEIHRQLMELQPGVR